MYGSKKERELKYVEKLYIRRYLFRDFYKGILRLLYDKIVIFKMVRRMFYLYNTFYKRWYVLEKYYNIIRL